MCYEAGDEAGTTYIFEYTVLTSNSRSKLSNWVCEKSDVFFKPSSFSKTEMLYIDK